jgi:glucokinase
MGRQLQARDLVYVIVGTGIGCAILIDGQVYRGRANSAGEIGHITIDRHGPISTGGVAGGVEVYAGGPAIEQHYARLSGTHLSGAEIAQRARVGDAHALSAFNDAGDALGAAIASVAMMMDVDLFVIGGSVSKAGDLVLEPARKAVLKYSFASVGPRIRIYATELHEDGAILGAAWLASKL